MKVGQVLYGIATFVPGVAAVFGRGAGDTSNARYCYSVWLRHLVKVSESDPTFVHPKVVAELGPGDSIGVGLAALLSGADEYSAFDVVAHANVKRNERIFEELLALFAARADVPDNAELPEVRPLISSHAFPRHILTDVHLARALAPSRIARIRDSIRNHDREDSMIRYRTRWFDETAVERESVDMLYSQAVLEHVDDLPGTYRAMALWVKNGGVLSHSIDFRCHSTAKEWNGHWRYSDLIWKLIRGKRSYLLNREAYSAHLQLLADNGFDLIHKQVDVAESRLRREDLAPRFRNLTDEDLTTSTAVIQALKRAG
jgi:hypothetical protein